MNLKDFENSNSGKCISTLKGYWAFVPNPLPPKITYDTELIHLLSEADRLLGELSGIGRALKNPYFLISPYMRREAVSSSRIEGVKASLRGLFFFEADELQKLRISDVREAWSYLQAMEHGLERLKDLPVSSRLAREVHKVLMDGIRAKHLTPGEFRLSQNWVGSPGYSINEARYVPPPAKEMRQALGEWEKYLLFDPKDPLLIQCALMHYQFEAIHPFIDGNGRVGRLLITFFLHEKGYLTQPLLYLSGFFEKHRDEYYSCLLEVSQKGEWRKWIEFFLQGVITQSKDAISDAKRILDIHWAYQNKLERSRKVPKSAYRLINEIFQNPVVSISTLSKKWNVSFMTIKRGVLRLVEIGILREMILSERHRFFIADELLELLSSSDREARRVFSL